MTWHDSVVVVPEHWSIVVVPVAELVVVDVNVVGVVPSWFVADGAGMREVFAGLSIAVRLWIDW